MARREEVTIARFHPNATLSVAEVGAGEGAISGSAVEAWPPVLAELAELIPCERDGCCASDFEPGEAGWGWRYKSIVCRWWPSVTKAKGISWMIVWAGVPAVEGVHADTSHVFEMRY